jgi:hypothetical protein
MLTPGLIICAWVLMRATMLISQLQAVAPTLPFPMPQALASAAEPFSSPIVLSGAKLSDNALEYLPLRSKARASPHPSRLTGAAIRPAKQIQDARAAQIDLPDTDIQAGGEVEDAAEDLFMPMTGGPPSQGVSARKALSGSAWLFWRQDSSGTASGTEAPTLGGSQTGFRLSQPLASGSIVTVGATARISAPIGAKRGKDVSLGAELRPTGSALRLLLERRTALDTGSQSGWSAIVTHGAERPIPRVKLKLITYAEAGTIFRKRADPFAFATLQIVRPIRTTFDIGIRATGDVQRGANRADAGPVFSLKLQSQPTVTMSADWRFRLLGNARPASGPSVTIATSF